MFVLLSEPEAVQFMDCMKLFYTSRDSSKSENVDHKNIELKNEQLKVAVNEYKEKFSDADIEPMYEKLRKIVNCIEKLLRHAESRKTKFEKVLAKMGPPSAVKKNEVKIKINMSLGTHDKAVEEAAPQDCLECSVRKQIFEAANYHMRNANEKSSFCCSNCKLLEEPFEVPTKNVGQPRSTHFPFAPTNNNVGGAPVFGSTGPYFPSDLGVNYRGIPSYMPPFIHNDAYLLNHGFYSPPPSAFINAPGRSGNAGQYNVFGPPESKPEGPEKPVEHFIYSRRNFYPIQVVPKEKPPTRTKQNGPKQRGDKTNENFFDRLAELFEKPDHAEKERDVAIWATNLQQMDPQQQKLVKEAIGKIIEQGQSGTLTEKSVQIVPSSPLPKK